MRLGRAFQIAAAALVILGATVAPAAAMSFEKVADGACAEQTCVLATGEIGADTADDFDRFVKANKIPASAVVVLNSVGGNLVQGLALGTKIRKGGFSTSIQGFDRNTRQLSEDGACASACAYAFLGGVQRSVGKDARYGVHQICAPANRPEALNVADAQVLLSLVAAHISRMGGAFEILTLALRTPPQKMRWLSSAELARYDVVTSPATFSSAVGSL